MFSFDAKYLNTSTLLIFSAVKTFGISCFGFSELSPWLGCILLLLLLLFWLGCWLLLLVVLFLFPVLGFGVFDLLWLLLVLLFGFESILAVTLSSFDELLISISSLLLSIATSSLLLVIIDELLSLLVFLFDLHPANELVITVNAPNTDSDFIVNGTTNLFILFFSIFPPF